MNAGEVESGVWSRRRWLAVITSIVLVHLGFIFWVGERAPVRPKRSTTDFAMYLPADQTASLPGLSDPTMFVLANRRGFSGPAWLKVPSVEYLENHLQEWTEPEPSPAPKPEPGRTLNAFAPTGLSRPFEVARKPEPELDTLQYPPPASLLAAESTFTIEGALAHRRLLSPFKLESRPATQILTNSEVLVAVNPEGAVFSAVLLANCGPKDVPGAADADAAALNLARSARFQPLRWEGAQPPAASPTSLTWGRLVFRWHSSPLPDTNAAPKNP